MPKSASPHAAIELPEWVSAARISELTGLTRRSTLRKIALDGVGERRPMHDGRAVCSAVFAPRSWVVRLLHERREAIEAAEA